VGGSSAQSALAGKTCPKATFRFCALFRYAADSGREAPLPFMSALTPIAEVARRRWHFRFVPQPDIPAVLVGPDNPFPIVSARPSPAQEIRRISFSYGHVLNCRLCDKKARQEAVCFHLRL